MLVCSVFQVVKCIVAVIINYYHDHPLKVGSVLDSELVSPLT